MAGGCWGAAVEITRPPFLCREGRPRQQPPAFFSLWPWERARGRPESGHRRFFPDGKKNLAGIEHEKRLRRGPTLDASTGVAQQSSSRESRPGLCSRRGNAAARRARENLGSPGFGGHTLPAASTNALPAAPPALSLVPGRPPRER